MLVDLDPKARVQRVAPWLTTDANAYPGGGERTEHLPRPCRPDATTYVPARRPWRDSPHRGTACRGTTVVR
jgi:hypothetical protein